MIDVATAMEIISGIEQQVMIAQVGRLGVRKGGTLECIKETLVETENWNLDPEYLGIFYSAAVETKEQAVLRIKWLLEDETVK